MPDFEHDVSYAHKEKLSDKPKNGSGLVGDDLCLFDGTFWFTDTSAGSSMAYGDGIAKWCFFADGAGAFNIGLQKVSGTANEIYDYIKCHINHLHPNRKLYIL